MNIEQSAPEWPLPRALALQPGELSTAAQALPTLRRALLQVDGAPSDTARDEVLV